MNNAKVVNYICKYFGIELNSEMIQTCSAEGDFNCVLDKCECDRAKKNREDILVKNTLFIQREFIPGPFQLKPAPDGYNTEDFFVCAPLKGKNDSFDSYYADKMYDYIEPLLRTKYPNYPFCFENFFGKVYCCLFLDPFKFVSYGIDSVQIRGIFRILDELIDTAFELI